MSVRILNDAKYESWVFAQLIVKEKVGYVIVKKEDQTKFNKTPVGALTVNIISNIKGIEVWIMFIKYLSFIREEFRSNGTLQLINIVEKFGGSGHIQPAECKTKSFDQVDIVINEANNVVKNFLQLVI